MGLHETIKKRGALWKIILFVVPRVFYYFLTILYSTCNIVVPFGKKSKEKYHTNCLDNPGVTTAWHQTILINVHCFKTVRPLSMASLSNDGDLIEVVAKKFGWRIIRGSSSRGGREAMHAMIERTNSETITTGLLGDAPRGPKSVLKMGIIKIARETGLPLFPVAMWADRYITFNSWDKTMLPMPFSTIGIYYGPTYYVPHDASPELMEKIRKQVEDRLNLMEKDLQEYFQTQKSKKNK